MDRRSFIRSLGGAVAAAMLPFREPIKNIFSQREIDTCGSLTHAEINYLTPVEMREIFSENSCASRCYDQGYLDHMEKLSKDPNFMRFGDERASLYDFLMDKG